MNSNTLRIAKNTTMLYFRHILILLVGLFTVRIKLETLGVDNFGIFNVVGGLVVMFTFLNSAMANATQRFLNFAMGKNDTDQVRNVFSLSIIIHIVMALIVIFLAETIGLWFFYFMVNIPPERQNAAFIVYQFSIASTVINILRVPYHATIIAYEKMSFFSILSIIEVLLKLLIVYLLIFILYDKLIVFSILTFLSYFLIFFAYIIYCNINFETAHFRYCKDKLLLRKLAEFFGWTAFGNFSYVSRTQGTNLLINIFYGVTINAAMGIATQVNSAVNAFLHNFQTAFHPQIIKSYSSEDFKYFFRLLFQTSKASFFLLFIFALPLFINAEYVLNLWLNNVPEYTVSFVRLILLHSLLDGIFNPLSTSVQATGDIKIFKIFVSIFTFANLPISLFFLWLGFNPSWVLIIRNILNVFINIWLLIYIKEKISFPVKQFIFEVVLPILLVAFISSILIYLLSIYFINFIGLILSCIFSTICISILSFLFILNKQERNIIQNWIMVKIFKRQIFNLGN